MRSHGIRIIPLMALALFMAGAAQAQVIIIDPRPEIPIARSYEIREVSVNGTIREQVAEIQVGHTLHNPGSRDLEAEFLFPIPAEGAVQSMTLLVDGKELPGRLLDKDEARDIYEEIVRRKRDPALMEYIGSGLYRTSVFPIPPGADRQVSIRYTQLCARDKNVVNFTYLLTPQKLCQRPIDKLKINLRIESQTPIKSIYSPTHDLAIERTGDQEARVKLEQAGVTPESDFRLLYSLDPNPLGVTVLSVKPGDQEQGYFLMLASPEIKRADEKPRPKTVVFVLDHSGSMSGKKIEQARSSLRFCLNNLREGDLFNIVSYSDTVETYKSRLQTFNEKSRAEAERFVNAIEAQGGTNINEALQSAMGTLAEANAKDRPGYVLFLTDGLPTVGELSELKIAENCKAANRTGARLFAFGVGYDVNARLLDRLSGGAGGVSEYVKPSEDIEAHVARFFSKLTSPVLSGIRVAASRGELGQMYPADIPDLFEGGQLVVIGRYREPGDARLTITGKIGDKEASYEYPIHLASADEVSSYRFVERLWAMRRVGYLIDQLDLHGQEKELTDELTRLSTKYGILTPYTAFLADERVDLFSYEINNARAGRMLHENLGDVSGAGGQAQRAFKSSLKRAENAAPSAAAAPSFPSPISGGGGTGSTSYVYPDAFDLSTMGTSSAGDVFRYKGDTATDEEVRRRGSNVRRLGAKTFYLKDGAWVDSGIKPEELKQAITIKPFSAEYFKLSRGLSAADNQFLTFKEPVVVNLAGKVYRISDK